MRRLLLLALASAALTIASTLAPVSVQAQERYWGGQRSYGGQHWGDRQRYQTPPPPQPPDLIPPRRGTLEKKGGGRPAPPPRLCPTAVTGSNIRTRRSCTPAHNGTSPSHSTIRTSADSKGAADGSAHSEHVGDSTADSVGAEFGNVAGTPSADRRSYAVLPSTALATERSWVRASKP